MLNLSSNLLCRGSLKEKKVLKIRNEKKKGISGLCDPSVYLSSLQLEVNSGLGVWEANIVPSDSW